MAQIKVAQKKSTQRRQQNCPPTKVAVQLCGGCSQQYADWVVELSCPTPFFGSEFNNLLQYLHNLFVGDGGTKCEIEKLKIQIFYAIDNILSLYGAHGNIIAKCRCFGIPTLTFISFWGENLKVTLRNRHAVQERVRFRSEIPDRFHLVRGSSQRHSRATWRPAPGVFPTMCFHHKSNTCLCCVCVLDMIFPGTPQCTLYFSPPLRASSPQCVFTTSLCWVNTPWRCV